jgi:hypothetical protein
MKQCGIARDGYLLNAHLHPLRGLRQGISIKNFETPARGITKDVIGISRLARKGGGDRHGDSRYMRTKNHESRSSFLQKDDAHASSLLMKRSRTISIIICWNSEIESASTTFYGRLL